MSKLKDNDIKVVIYGCGEYGKRLVEFFQNSYDFPHVIAFIDKTYGGGVFGDSNLFTGKIKRIDI